MSDLRVDIAVIGAGAAGLSVTAVAAQLGLRVALIEAGAMGGDCLNTGCVPSKAMLAASHAAQAARAAGRFGVRLPEPGIDWPAMRAHMRGVIAGIAPMDSVERFRGLGATVLEGHARFVAPDTLEVDTGGTVQRVQARRIVIAAGSTAAVPPIPGLDAVPFLTNATVFDLEAPPAHLLILGGGPIGVELAQAHAGLGCKVTLVARGRILAREDPELTGPLHTTLRTQGVAILEDAAVTAMEPGPTLVLADGTRITGSHLLVAVGRTPNLAGLGLDAGGVQATAQGIATDAGLRSLTNRRVFAVGDIADPAGIGPRHFTHVGSYHAGIVVRRMLFRLPARVDYTALPRVTYTDPELAQVGPTEAEARAAGHRVHILRWAMRENDRAATERATDGLVKLVVARGRLGGARVLGAGIISPHAGEMVGPWSLAISRRIPLSALAGQILPYPTRSEAGKRAAGNFFTPSLFSSRTKFLIRLLSRLR